MRLFYTSVCLYPSFLLFTAAVSWIHGAERTKTIRHSGKIPPSCDDGSVDLLDGVNAHQHHRKKRKEIRVCVGTRVAMLNITHSLRSLALSEGD